MARTNDPDKPKAEEAEPGGVASQVTRAIPDLVVVVREGNTVSHGGKEYLAGDEVSLEGPTAISLLQGGHVTIKGNS